MKRAHKRRTAFRYRLDRSIREFVMKVMSWITPAAKDERIDFQADNIRRILIVRSLFRMGDTILATPAILLFRRNFPAAKIDFVGSSISKALVEKMPVDGHFEVYRSFPRAAWSYLMLLKKIRGAKYDLAFDASGSSAALGSFIVGFSAARLRVGLKGKWDRWFNIRLDRPRAKNKYRVLPELIRCLGLKSRPIYPRVFLSRWELQQGRAQMREHIGEDGLFVVGIFVGGRKSRGKRWAKENFVEIATRLFERGAQPVIFVGPEERDLLPYFRGKLKGRAPVVFEPDVRAFASLIANCNLFVACDSGPVHLACALGVRTVVIFLHDDFERWAPPAALARVIRRDEAASIDAIFEACVREYSGEEPTADRNIYMGSASVTG